LLATFGTENTGPVVFATNVAIVAAYGGTITDKSEAAVVFAVSITDPPASDFNLSVPGIL